MGGIPVVVVQAEAAVVEEIAAESAARKAAHNSAAERSAGVKRVLLDRIVEAKARTHRNASLRGWCTIRRAYAHRKGWRYDIKLQHVLLGKDRLGRLERALLGSGRHGGMACR